MNLCKNPPGTLSELVNFYNTTLSSAIDRHAPLVTRSIRSWPLVPWFNDEIKKSRGPTGASQAGGRYASVQGSQKQIEQPDECCTQGVLQRPHLQERWRLEEAFLGNE